MREPLPLLMILILLCFNLAWANEDAERRIVLAWEPVPEALSYDVEIGIDGQKAALKAENFLPHSKWTGLLTPGKYWMRVRARDERNVPGEWGDKSEVQVKLPKVDVIRPTSDAVLATQENQFQTLFEWKPVPGASSYSFYIEDNTGKVIETIKLKSTSTQLTLPSAMKYRWFVQALDSEGRVGEKEKTNLEFTIEGSALEKPQINKPETQFVRSIDYKLPPEAQAVTVRVQRFDPEKKDWVLIQEQEEKPSTALPFPQTWPGGRYLVSMKTIGQFRSASAPSEVSFDVFSGRRTASVENQALIRKSLERNESWFGQLSYVITRVQYQGINFESDVRPSLAALTGTASLNVGRFWTGSNYGVNFGLSSGGILLNGKNTLLFGQEVLGLWRQNLNGRDDLRVAGGISHREIPEARLSGDPNQLELGKMDVLGAKFGSEYWYALDRKIGLQGHLYMTTPIEARASNGTKINSGLTTDVGLMGSYRWTPKTTWLLGYTYSNEQYSYPGQNVIKLQSGTNEVQLSAHYLHLMVEYGF